MENVVFDGWGGNMGRVIYTRAKIPTPYPKRT